MSHPSAIYMQGVKAGADLTGLEGKAVKISADNTVSQVAGLTDVAVGIIGSGNLEGKAVDIMSFGPEGQVEAGAAIVAGVELAQDATGRMVTAVAGKVVRGIAKDSASAAGEFVNVVFISYVKPV